MVSDSVLHPLTESQKSIWYLEKAYPGTSINIVAGTLRLKGEVCYSALEKALNLFVKKNDSMRLRIVERDGEPMQYVTEYREFKLDFFDFSKGGGLKDLFSWDEEMTRKPFDTIDNELFYCALFKVSDEEGGYYMKMHHLISDAWTMGMAIKDVVSMYSAIRNGRHVDDSPNPSYFDHLVAEAEYERSARFERDREYWLAKFETIPEMTVLKPPRSAEVSIRAKRKTMITPVKLSNKIREFSATHGLSPFTLFMSALAIYINRVTGLEDIVLGTTTLNRVNSREKETTGMFVSVAAPVRIRIDDSADFITFARAMLKESTDVLRHQKYPYNYLVRDLKKIHRLNRRLFDIVLNYQNAKFRKSETEETYVAKWLFSGYQVESLVISINDREDSGSLIIDYDFLTDVFDIREIEFIHQHIISILWHALDNPAKKISKLEMISEKERQTILRDFNNTYSDYPRDKTIHQIFEEQSEKRPDDVAVVFGGRRMTYAELNERASRLANLLRDNGVGPDKVVAISAYRSFEMMVGILAILKAGGAYLPIDPDYPAERRNYMLKNSCTGVFLAQRGAFDSLEFSGLLVDLDDPASYSGDARSPARVNSPRDLAYVIYTSGSTGRPKGVMIEHTAVVNRINWMEKKYPLGEDGVVLQKTPFSFDVSVWELFWWFFAGAKVCFLKPGGEKDPEEIIRAVEENNVTTMHFVPPMLSAFLDYVESRGCAKRLASLRNVFASGEALSLQQVELFNRLLYEQNGTRLVNLYGPTEATVDVSYFDCSPTPPLTTVPIGKPIDNISLYILDKNQNLLPVGVPGELYIGGVGVARGYLFNPELTSERFVINPYKRNEILYRTGDRARWFPKGDIEYLGRVDFQVKIRGFRIEPGEIEAQLLSHPAVREAAVKAFSGEEGAFLAAYVVADGETGPDEIREHLSRALPDYMVPTYIEFVDELPKSPNGKIDRNALLKPQADAQSKAEHVPPSGETESALAEIWGRVLGVEKVGALDDYAWLGGDSLNAIKIVVEIHKRFGADISPREVFTLGNIRRLAARVNEAGRKRGGGAPIGKVPAAGWYEVSSAQRRQFILNRIDGGIHYNLPGGLLISGKVDPGKVKAVIEKLIERHESLRTSFEMREGRPVQIVSERAALDFSWGESEEADFDALMRAFVRPFDLGKSPLIRARLVSFSELHHLLMLDMHHIISDGESVNILLREIAALLDGREPTRPAVDYKDYAAWQGALLRSDEMKRHEEYWLGKFAGEVPVLEMPLDFPRPAVPSFRGSAICFTVDAALSEDMRRLASKTGTTLFMLLFAAYSVLLSKYTGQEDIVIGTPVSGRLREEVQDVVGMFVNTLALRTAPAGEKEFSKYLAEVKDEVLGAFEHQEYPFEELVEKAGVRRDTGRNPLFDAAFVLQNMVLGKFKAGGLELEPRRFDCGTSKFDLTLEAADGKGAIECRFEYSTDLFTEDTVRRMSSHFLNILSEVVRKPDRKIADIDMLSEHERRLVLVEFNDTDADYPRERTIHEIFEERAEKAPDSVALSFEGKTMTYRELNSRAGRLARKLIDMGVRPDGIVGLMVHRSFEMVVAILGVLKAGGAYMPIDPDYPPERVRYMLEDSGAKALVTDRGEVPGVPDGIRLVSANDDAVAGEEENPRVDVKPSNLAYIIYTSGSTGRPKGVMIEHSSVVRLLFNSRFQFEFGPSDVWTLFHSYCFDFSVWEMYGALLYGGRLVIVKKQDAVDTGRFLEILKSERVTVLNQTPSAFYNLISADARSDSRIPALRYVIFGGEALKPQMLLPFMQKYPDVKLINMYGITETTVHVTFKELTLKDAQGAVSNVGRPIPTLRVYILDRHLNPLPVGVPGEICVAGAGVSRGYLGNEELTRQKFVDIQKLGQKKVYRSGDLGRWLPNGDIEYLGRMDGQVKVRGYRIEPGEIESALMSHPEVEEALVLAVETGGGEKKLCAYLRSNSDLSARDMAGFLSERLPAYMVPQYFVRMEAFPLNRNGKIDRSNLPKPSEAQHPGRGRSVPRNVLEEEIAEVWARVLDVPEVGIDDDFFEMGGDSLTAIRAVSMLDMGIRAVDLYTYPTVRRLAEKLAGDGRQPGLLVCLARGWRESGANVVCFPYGGGNALAYKDLAAALKKAAPEASLFSVSLPGHDFGANDDLQPLEEVAKAVAREIEEKIAGELVLYGHCVGSAMLLAVAGILEERGVAIKAAFIGGILPPRLRGLNRFYKPWMFVPDSGVVGFLKKIGMPKDLLEDSGYTRHIIRAFRHDAACFAKYLSGFGSGGKRHIKAPLCLVVGDADLTTRGYARRYRQWSRYFETVRLAVLKNADHYFINTHADELVRLLLKN